MTTHEQIRKYMDALGWSTIYLSRLTNIHHITLSEILAGEKEPTIQQLMMIINKIVIQYPKEQHWSIYHDIALEPFMGEKK